ncbi:AMP-binding protein [Futiania mangrovi]|uniref:acetate--CoA ligase n=1 Tax=Futiania mangrovi TaxID=2959716 RepID=A0A9J6PLV9_9PROT|nr:AMP-binding protein [Futiania mangrovii]MCP1337026.1 AMP-binding protein [Futiania mangrovii]
MSESAPRTWHPRPQDLTHSCPAQMMRHTGQADFDSFYAWSLAEPEAYWRRMNDYLGIRWRKDYDRLCDLSRGKEFPSWFVGGELNWTDTVLDRADDPAFRDKPAIVAETEDGHVTRVTYAELRDLVARVATGLAEQGIVRGDRVGLLMENGVEASAAVMALAYIGAIVVPLFSGFGAEPILSRLEACKARGLIATTGFLRRGAYVDAMPTVREVCSRLPTLERLILKVSPHHPADDPLPADAVAWTEVTAPEGPRVAPLTMSANDPFMVIFTSGTTGKPKGPVHTHGGFPIRIAHDAALNFNVKAESVFCWPADMGWIAGTLVMCSALMRGATLVCYDGAPDFPDWSRMGRLVETYRVTHFGSAPTLIRGFAAHAETATAPDLSSIELLITAGEGIAPEHFLWFQTHFGRGEVPLINYTGGTEVSGALLGSVVVKPIVPAGFNARGGAVAVDVVDLDGKPVTLQTGELVVREPFVGMTASFWEDDARYLETYWSAIPGLWVHGDLAMRDATGQYFMLGRSDDTIKVAGKRVGPAEVEAILVELAGVEEAAVIGVPDPLKGQAIVAFLTGSRLRETREFLAEVRKRVQDRLGKPFAPREVYLVQQLPKTRSSKIMRRVIRGIYTDAPQGDLTALVNPDAIGEIARIVGSR